MTTTFNSNIEACKFAQSQGLRVQYLKRSTGKWTTVRNPRYDMDDDAYRIHPDDVVEVKEDTDTGSAREHLAVLGALDTLLREHFSGKRGGIRISLSIEID